MQGFIEFLAANWRELLILTREHIFIVLLSTGLAILVGLPLGIILTRIRSLQPPILGFANIMQTVPSLALFGLLIPIPFIGGIGARTAIIALALYALLPVIRNTVTGILGIDPKIREAAVIGRAHEKWGEVPVAVVALDDADGTLTLEELEPFLNENLARYKHPKELVIVAELPRNASGKVVKVELRKDGA